MNYFDLLWVRLEAIWGDEMTQEDQFCDAELAFFYVDLQFVIVEA